MSFPRLTQVFMSIADYTLFPVCTGEEEGSILGVVSVIRPGNGSMVVPGRVENDVMEAAQVATSWACSQVGPLCRWLRPASLKHRKVLWRAHETLVVYISRPADLKRGDALTVATALSLVSLLTRRQIDEKVAMTSGMDLRGNILDVGGLLGKIRACMKAGIDTLLVPQVSLQRLSIDALPVDLRDYARSALQGVRTITEVIRLAIEGEVLLSGQQL